FDDLDLRCSPRHKMYVALEYSQALSPVGYRVLRASTQLSIEAVIVCHKFRDQSVDVDVVQKGGLLCYDIWYPHNSARPPPRKVPSPQRCRKGDGYSYPIVR